MGPDLKAKYISSVRSPVGIEKDIRNLWATIYIIVKKKEFRGESTRSVSYATHRFIIFTCLQTPKTSESHLGLRCFLLGFCGFFLFPGKYEVISFYSCFFCFDCALRSLDSILFYALAIVLLFVFQACELIMIIFTFKWCLFLEKKKKTEDCD